MTPAEFDIGPPAPMTPWIMPTFRQALELCLIVNDRIALEELLDLVDVDRCVREEVFEAEHPRGEEGDL